MLNKTITTTTEMMFGDISINQNNQSVYYYPVVENLSKIYQLFIIVIGLIGNTITIVIFGRTKQKLRRTSDTAFYLISLAIIDILSLFTVTGKYLDTNTPVKLGQFDTWCKAIVYLNFVLNFISCGIVVTFTLQRFCSICFPLRSASSNIHRHAKLILSMLVTTGFLIYMPVWSKFRSNEQGRCDYAPDGDDFMQRFLFLDSLLTLIIPFLGLLIMNAMIIRTLKNSNYNFVIHNSSNRHYHEPPNNQHPAVPGADLNPNNNNNNNNIAIQHYNNGIIPNGNTQQMNNNFDNLQRGVDMGLGLAVNSANNSPGTLIYSKPKRNGSILKTSKKGLDENGKQKQANSASFKVAKFTSSKTGDGNTIINNHHNHQPSFRNDSLELEPLNNRYHHHANSNTDSQLRFHNSFLFFNGGHGNKKRHSSIDKSKCCEDCFANLLRTHSDSSSIYSSSILTQNMTGGVVVAAQNSHHHHHHHHHHNSQHGNHNDLNGSFISGFKQKRRGQIVLKTINSSGVMAERTSTGAGSTTLNCTTTQQQQNRNNTSPSNSTVNNNNAASDLANAKQQPNSTNSVFDAVNGEFANGGANLPSSQKDKKRRSIFGFRGREKKNSEDHFNIAPHLRKNGGGGMASSMNESMENQMNNTNTGTTRGSVNQKTTNSNHRRSILMNGGGNRNGTRYSTTARMMRANSYRHGGAQQTKSVSRRVTKMLILVSSVFLLLNFPVHAYNLYVYYKVSLLKLHDPYAQFSPNQIEYNVEEIVLIIFFTSFSCNFLLYSISGVTFRTEFKRLFFKIVRVKKSSPKPPKQR